MNNSISNLIFLIILTLQLVGCDNSEKFNSEEFYSKLNVVPEKFVINNNIDTFIFGKQGTAIFIPAKSLVYEDGKYPTNQINLVLKEYYSKSEIISLNESVSTLIVSRSP